METSGECPLCGGRGWVVLADGGAGSARRCECQGRDLVPRRMAEAGIPERYRDCRLRHFSVGSQDASSAESLLRAKSVCESYVEDFLGTDGQFSEHGLLLIGPPGVGKTHLATAVLIELIERYGIDGKFADFTSLVYLIQSTFSPGSSSSKSSILDPIVGAEVLVLDELGAQKTSAWLSEFLYLVLNTRYTRRLPTIFTTNYYLEAAVSTASGDEVSRFRRLSTRIPEALVSRLYEMTVPVEISSVDFREKVKRPRHGRY